MTSVVMVIMIQAVRSTYLDWMTEKKKGYIMAGKRRKKVERKRGKKGRASKNQKKKV